jgi:poly-gamma-glutamate synthase PgsB/CapB
MLLVFFLAVAYLAYGILEYRLHIRNVRAIPIRVHVNGTRGKSSVTRLIAAGLRAGGVRTVAKTTGSAARYIDADGGEETVVRAGPPNIREQLRVVSRARRERAQALVLECMAIRPDLQLLSEHRIVKSTVGVITNVRPDHLDVMGPTVDDVACSLAGTVPDCGIVFTAEHERLAPIRREAERRATEIKEVLHEAYDPTFTQGFRYVEHLENVAVALEVCEHLGVNGEVALKGMRDVRPDPGALLYHRVREEGKEIEFVSAFAANDRESTMAVWAAIDPASDPDRAVIVVASMRADRPDRAYEFGEIIANDIEADSFVLAGDLTHLVRKVATKLGLSPSKIFDLGGKPAEHVFEKLVELTPSRSIVIGVGNIGGTGTRILSMFRERSDTR